MGGTAPVQTHAPRRPCGMAALRNHEREQPADGLEQTANNERDRHPNEQDGEWYEQNEATRCRERSQRIDEGAFARARWQSINRAPDGIRTNHAGRPGRGIAGWKRLREDLVDRELGCQSAQSNVRLFRRGCQAPRECGQWAGLWDCGCRVSVKHDASSRALWIVRTRRSMSLASSSS